MCKSYPLETLRTDIGGTTGSSLSTWDGGRFFKILLIAKNSKYTRVMALTSFDTETHAYDLTCRYKVNPQEIKRLTFKLKND